MTEEARAVAPLFFTQTGQALWSVQVVLCAAFVTTFWGLASRLLHPLMRALFVFLVLRLVITLAVGAYWWFNWHATAAQLLVGLILGAGTGAGFRAAVAVARTAGGEPFDMSWRGWVGSAALGGIALPAFISMVPSVWPGSTELAVVLGSRLAFYLPYAVLAGTLWRALVTNAEARPQGQPLFAGTIVLLALAVPDTWLRFNALASPLSRQQSVVAVGVAILGTLLFGVGALLGALESERLHIRRNAERLREARVRLVDSERLQSLGEVASGVAHDFNNVLAAILGGVDLALSELGRNPQEARAELQAIQAGAQRGAALTHRLLQFARRRPAEPRPFSPAAVLNEFVPVLARLVHARVSLDLVIETTGDVLGDPSQFEQIVLNLVTNARDAVPAGQRIRLSLDEVADITQLEVSYGRSGAGPYVRLVVEDAGSGIPPEQLGRVFDAFFSTKGTAGTGLGLATVARILDELHGAAHVVSRVGHGTRFSVFLPRTG